MNERIEGLRNKLLRNETPVSVILKSYVTFVEFGDNASPEAIRVREMLAGLLRDSQDILRSDRRLLKETVDELRALQIKREGSGIFTECTKILASHSERK